MSDTAAHHHPTPRDYWAIAAVLFVITAVEVAVFYIEALKSVEAPILIFLSGIKFVLVVGWFMHLRYDSPAYRRLFLIGLVAAPLLLGTVLFTFGVLIGS